MTPEEQEMRRVQGEKWIESEELRSRGEFSRARELLESAFAQFPDDTRMLRSLAEVCSELGDHQEALTLFSQYFAHPYVDKVDPCVLVGYGEELLAAGRKSEALDAFTSAVEHSTYDSKWSDLPDASPPNNDFNTVRAAAHLGSGFKAYGTAGHRDRGIREYRKAVEIAPSYEVARLHLALALVRLKDEKASLEAQPLFNQLTKSKSPAIQRIASDHSSRIEHYKRTQPLREQLERQGGRPFKVSKPADDGRKTD